MKPEQENLLLNIMGNVSDKLEKQQNKWWVRAAVIYGIIIMLMGGLAKWNMSQSDKINDLYEKNHQLELRLQKIETRHEEETKRVFNTMDSIRYE